MDFLVFHSKIVENPKNREKKNLQESRTSKRNCTTERTEMNRRKRETPKHHRRIEWKKRQNFQHWMKIYFVFFLFCKSIWTIRSNRKLLSCIRPLRWTAGSKDYLLWLQRSSSPWATCSRTGKNVLLFKNGPTKGQTLAFSSCKLVKASDCTAPPLGRGAGIPPKLGTKDGNTRLVPNQTSGTPGPLDGQTSAPRGKDNNQE